MKEIRSSFSLFKSRNQTPHDDDHRKSQFVQPTSSTIHLYVDLGLFFG